MVELHAPLDAREPLDRRNRRTAALLVGWIAFLTAVSLAVIWLRN